MMVLVLLASGLADAADCAPVDEAGLRSRVAEAKAAVDRDDLVSFAETRRSLLNDLPCLDGPLPVDAWARFLLDEAVVAYALGEPWETALGTALSLDPGLPRTDVPEELRAWTPPAPEPSTGGALGPGDFLLDGLPIFAAPELSGLHVVQRDHDGVLTTRVLRDAPFPEDWRAASEVPPPSAGRSRGSPALLAAGVVAAVAGSAVGVGTWAARGSVHDPAAADRLVGANVAGWGLAAVGVVLGGVGLVLPGPVAADPVTANRVTADRVAADQGGPRPAGLRISIQGRF